MLIKLPDGTPLMAVADLGPGLDPLEVAELVCRRVNLVIGPRPKKLADPLVG